jgi:predicted nuclease of predicted toxin-antitoxin system
MKLLFDHHLSPRLANRLGELFPDSSHVYLHSLDQADDRTVWEFARQHGFTLVTRDSDFSDLSALRGFPPRVLWLRIGNCTTRQAGRHRGAPGPGRHQVRAWGGFTQKCVNGVRRRASVAPRAVALHIPAQCLV